MLAQSFYQLLTQQITLCPTKYISPNIAICTHGRLERICEGELLLLLQAAVARAPSFSLLVTSTFSAAHTCQQGFSGLGGVGGGLEAAATPSHRCT